MGQRTAVDQRAAGWWKTAARLPFVVALCLWIAAHPASAIERNGTSGSAAAATSSATSSPPRRDEVRAATIVVATADSSAASQAAAQFVGDGTGDEHEINAALRALPDIGGTVLLMEGTYDIRHVAGTLGGVLIERSNVVLAGQGTSTRLVQAAGQNTNVIRIIGAGVGNITIRDLFVDANREQNNTGAGDSNVSHARFEFCGIKALSRAPGAAHLPDTHGITIRNCVVKNAHRLGIMLEGPSMRVLDNVLGDCGSDAVEILTGPGMIRGNYAEITGRTHVAIGTDRANSVIMQANIVHVRSGGKLDIGFRSWAESDRHNISDNVLTVDSGGECAVAVDVRGSGAVVLGNQIHAADAAQPTRIKITAGNVIVSNNMLENVILEVDDTTNEMRPIVVSNNLLEHSSIDHRRGALMRDDGR